MLYIGTYHDQEFNLRLDFNSIATKSHHCVNKLYDDMVQLHIVDGSAQHDAVDKKIDELNQSECDFIMLDEQDKLALMNILN